MDNYKLCYVDLPWCYFTTQELSNQWGDDWNDAPYEHNAGVPYTWLDEKTPKYDVMIVAIDSDLEAPCEYHFNSPYSVEMINNGVVPWLKSPSYSNEKIEIMAGTSFDDFVRWVKSVRGKVYVKME